MTDPNPDRTLIGPPHAHLDAPCTDACYEPATTEPSPTAQAALQQACDAEGIPLFIHGCGTVMPSSVSGVAKGEHYRYPPCSTPGPWRPLYVTSPTSN